MIVGVGATVGTAPTITGTPLLTDNAISVPTGDLPMTFHYLSVTGGAVAPSTATIKAAPDSRLISSIGENVLTGLFQESTPGDWDLYYLLANAAGDSATIMESYVVSASGPTLVGKKKVAIPASSGTNTTVSLTDLTGGSGSAPIAGDTVLIGYAIATSGVADTDVALVTSGYAEIADLYADGVVEANLAAFWKRMSGSPDTEVVAAPTGSVNRPGEMTIEVWRGVNVTPMDVPATTSTNPASGRPVPAAITPATPGAIVVVIGAAAFQDNSTVFVSSDLSNFDTEIQQGTQDIGIGMGSYAWTSGAYTPAAWTGGTTSTNDSCAAITIALKPA